MLELKLIVWEGLMACSVYLAYRSVIHAAVEAWRHQAWLHIILGFWPYAQDPDPGSSGCFVTSGIGCPRFINVINAAGKPGVALR